MHLMWLKDWLGVQRFATCPALAPNLKDSSEHLPSLNSHAKVQITCAEAVASLPRGRMRTANTARSSPVLWRARSKYRDGPFLRALSLTSPSPSESLINRTCYPSSREDDGRKNGVIQDRFLLRRSQHVRLTVKRG